MNKTKQLVQLFPHSYFISRGVLTGLTLLAAGCGNDTRDSTTEAAAPAQHSTAVTAIASAELSNYSAFARSQESVYFSYADLGVEANTAGKLAVTLGSSVVPFQAIDTDSDGENDGIVVAIDLDAEGKTSIEFVEDAASSKMVFTKQTQAEISHKEGGEWKPHTKTEGFQEYVGGSFKNVSKLTPPDHYTDHSNWIRYEGPGIESDKVGYRIYLDWRNGYDIFGKSVAEPVLQKVGQDGYESYHHKQAWGMDILKVGSSLGAGGFGFWDGKKIHNIGKSKSRTATITNNGSIYSSVKINYLQTEVGGKMLDITSNLSMVAGSRLVHNQIKLSDSLPNLAIGIVKHKNTEFLQGPTNIPGDTFTYIGSWGKQSLNDDHLGMAVIYRPRNMNEIVNDPKSYAVTLRPRGEEMEYYFVAAWEGEHGTGITSKEAFVAYLEQEIEKLTIPARVRLKTALSQQAAQKPLTAAQAIAWSSKLADAELARKTLKYHAGGWDTHRKRTPRFEYDIVGLNPVAYSELAKETGNPAYASVLYKVTGSFINEKGEIAAYKQSNYNIDSVAPGRAVLELFKQTNEGRLKIAADTLREQLHHHPKTSEGAYWHKKRYPHQLWLDGVYMGMPFLAQHSSMFDDGSALEEVVNEFNLTRKYLRDPKTGLYYHGWDEAKQQDWANPETGLSAEFWGRGMGWLAMAVVDTLDYIPADNHELRAPLVALVVEIADTLVEYQDQETKTWWQIMDKPSAPGNYRESSASAMYTYFFAKAVRNGYLDESYTQVALDSYQGLINEFARVHPDGTMSMTNQCYVAGLGFGRSGSYDYYMSEIVSNNDPKGNAPFILSGVEISRLLSKP